jgi:hypothetical protein
MVVAGCKPPNKTLLQLLLDVRKTEVTMERKEEKMKEAIRKKRKNTKSQQKRG